MSRIPDEAMKEISDELGPLLQTETPSSIPTLSIDGFHPASKW